MGMIREAVGGSGDITINVYGAPGQDERALAREVADIISDQFSREKAAAFS
jgi:hypothetical protein